jgi:hypothetical protein
MWRFRKNTFPDLCRIAFEQMMEKSLDKLTGSHFAQRKIQGEFARKAGGESQIQIVRDIFQLVG